MTEPSNAESAQALADQASTVAALSTAVATLQEQQR